MDEIDLPGLLEDASAYDDQDVLARIVRRHGRLRARRARVAASVVVFVALAGAGLGVGLAARRQPAPVASGGIERGAGAARAPAGLAWENAPAGGGVLTAGPGVFGWLTSAPPGGLMARAATGRPAAVTGSPPAAVLTPASAGALMGRSVCVRRSCGPIHSTGSLRRLFERRAAGVTIEAQLDQFSIPMGKTLPEMLPAASHPGRTLTGAGAEATPRSSGHPVRLAVPCLSQFEIVVTISSGGSTATLAVPGGTSRRPFSVVASAAVVLGGRVVVLAVTHTDVSVRAVSAEFPGGATDRMAPIDGWSVLASATHPAGSLRSAGAARLLATSAAGRALEHVELPATGSLALAPEGTCRYWIAAPMPVSLPVASGSG